MKKKLMAILLGVSMVSAVLSACGGSASTATTAAKAATTAAASKAAGTTAAAAATTAAASKAAGTTAAAANTSGKKYKIAMVLDSSVSDGGWGASCYQAMLDAAKEKGWETAYTDNVKQSDYATSFTDYCDQGYNLIFAPGNQYSDAVSQVAEEYPDIDFCLLNGIIETKNITSVMPDAKQIGYLAGALAGLLSKSNSIGFIGGMELDTTKSKLECYTKAAQKVNPSIKVQSAYAGSFSDTAKGKEIASTMISSQNVDVLFGDASAVDAGAREACKSAGKCIDIGQPGDLGKAEDTVIACSVVTDNAALVKQCMDDVESGKYGSKTVSGNLQNGCLSIGTFSTSLVPADIQKKYAEYVDQIKAGTFIQ